MEADSEPPDGGVIPSTNTLTEDPAASLSNSLENLTINQSVTQQPPSPSQQHGFSHELSKSPSLPSLKNGIPQRRTSRRSSAAFIQQTGNISPKPNRRSSGLSANNELQSTPTKPAFRRAASSPYSPKSPGTAFPSVVLERSGPLPPTASAVAAEHFKKELALHSTQQTAAADTIVVIHDSCYGHRYSRPKTSKTILSLVVERPERIQAGVLGLSSAYVRLGKRHSDYEHAPHPQRLPSSNVPFLIHKSTRSTPLSSSSVTNVHGTKWMQELTIMCNAAESKLASGGKELSRPGTPGLSTSKPRLHEGDLYLCRESLDAFQGALGGVLDGIDVVFGKPCQANGISSAQSPRKAFVCVRPPGHHCSADMPSGFCWLNNVHVGIEHAALAHGLTHAAIIDFDLHHGDGSQAITWERNAKAARQAKNSSISKKTAIGYFSLHDINSYPCEDGDREKVQSASLCLENAHGQSIWNVHLQPWKTEADFWDHYENRYMVLVEKARAFLRTQTLRFRALGPTVQPRAAIFISAGFDASEWEGEGMQRHKVNVPTEFYARFTSDILKLAEEDDTAVEGRVVSVLEGGYSDRALMTGVMSHLTGLTGTYSPKSSSIASAGSEEAPVEHHENATWDKSWWSSEALSEIENQVRPPAISAQSRKPRANDLTTYADHTRASTAKVVDPSKLHRTVSASFLQQNQPRPPTPPPPEVEWAVAAYELSRLLIPADRQINSCRHEELSEPRIKKERHSSIGIAPVEPPPAQRQLRDRKGKAPLHGPSTSVESVNLPIRRQSNTGRRRTISDLSTLLDESQDQPPLELKEHLERPQTSDSKAHSEGSVAEIQSVVPTAIKTPTKSSTAAGSSYNLPTTKQEGDGFVKPPPKQRQPRISAVAAKKPITQASKPESRPPLGSGPNVPDVDGDMESLTSGVKKITLRMPSTETQEQRVSGASVGAVKPVKKPAAPRATKTTGTKNALAKTSKISKVNPESPVSLAENATEVKERSFDQPGIHSNDTMVLNNTNAKLPEVSNDAGSGDAFSARSPPIDATFSQATSSTGMLNATSSLPGNIDFNPGATSDPSTIVPSSLAGTTNSPRIAAERAAGSPEAPGQLKDVELASAPQSLEFVHFNPYAQYSNPNNEVPPPSTLTWLAPNSNTPVQSPARRGKENLPVFSANSYIPFAGNNRETLGETQTDVANVVDPPKQQTELATREHMEKPTVGDEDIWAVPVTPQR